MLSIEKDNVEARGDLEGGVAHGKPRREFELTVRRRSSNKDSNCNQLRRVLDEDDEVPARLLSGDLFVRTAL